MKRSRINPISAKQRKRETELAKMMPPLDGKCQECGELPDWRGLIKHHKIFRSQGGGDTKVNIIWVCGPCLCVEDPQPLRVGPTMSRISPKAEYHASC